MPPQVRDEQDQRPEGYRPAPTGWPGLIRATALRAVLYGVLWRTLSSWLIGPLTLAVFHLFLKLDREQAITNLQIANFVLSPVGTLAFVSLAVLVLATWLLEQAGFARLILCAMRGEPCSVADLLRELFVSTPRLLRTAVWPVLASGLTLLPFVGIAGAVYYLMLSGTDINYYLAERPPRFQWALALGGLIGLAAVWALVARISRWIFAPALCLELPVSGRAILSRSEQTTQGRRRRLTIGVMMWFLVGTLATSLILAGWTWACDRFLDRTNLHWTATTWVIGGLVLLSTAIASTLGILKSFSLALLTCISYQRALAERSYLMEPNGELGLVSPKRGGSHLSGRGVALTFIILATVLASTILHARLLISQSMERRPVAITAHRAGSLRAPENSLSALHLAFQEGAEYAEIDVQRTADGTIVVVHDQDLKRLAGISEPVRRLTIRQVEAADISGRFSQFRGERVPTLRQFIDAARNRLRLNIELKYYGFDDQLAPQVIELLRETRFSDQVVITSLEMRGLQQVRQLAPQIPVGTIVSASVGDITRLDVQFLSLRQSLVTPAMRRLASKRNLQIHAWTPNNSDDLLRMVLRGADNVITDDPALASEVLNWYEQQTDEQLVLLHFWDFLR